jgi:Tfp pilus assembly protein PilX
MFKNINLNKNKKGQVMIIVSLALGGVMLTSIVIGGILISNQIRQAGNITNSAKALYAADAALEWGMYQFYKNNIPDAGSPSFTNNSTYATLCYSGSSVVSCTGGNITDIVGKGNFGKVSRAFQISF